MPFIFSLSRHRLRTYVVFILLCTLFYTGIVAAQSSSTKSKGNNTHWVATWAAAPDSPGPALPVQTLRQIMRVSVGGEAVRVRISNEYGDQALQVTAATIAYHAQAGSIIADSAVHLRLAGKDQFAIPAGESILSDPVKLSVLPRQELAISLFFAKGTGISTIHSVGMQTVYISNGDDQTRQLVPRIDSKDDSRYFITDIEVLTDQRVQSLIVIGDSTSDGVGSEMDANSRWPDQLADRLQQTPNYQHVAVVNSGIAGNRILNDGLEPFLGPSALKRFERDVLEKANVKWVLLLEGSNDIAASGFLMRRRSKSLPSKLSLE